MLGSLGCDALRLPEPPSMAPDRGLCALLCPVAAARAEVPALPYQMLAFWWSVHHFPECQAFLHHSTLPNTISSPRLKTVFLGMGLNRSKYKRASYTLLARKLLTLSLTYTAEVNQWNVLHRLRKICFICSSANSNQILWGKKCHLCRSLVRRSLTIKKGFQLTQKNSILENY